MNIEIRMGDELIDWIIVTRIKALENNGTKKEYSYRIESSRGGIYFITHDRKDGALVLASKALNELVRIGETGK